MFNLVEQAYYYMCALAIIVGGFTSVIGTWYACYYAAKLFQVGV